MIEDRATSLVDKAAGFDPAVSKKRKMAATSTPKSKGPVMNLTDETRVHSPSAKKKKGASSRKAKDGEKRMRRFRLHAPSSYLERLNRATTQRMFVIDRTHGGTPEIPEETIELAGTTGNVYSITICQLPSCTCPDSQKSNQSKILHNVLKAPEHLQYQLAFLSSVSPIWVRPVDLATDENLTSKELHEIFAAAPAPASSETSASSDAPSNRKEASGDCPICFTEFEADRDEIVWCRAKCGNNLHRDCFEQWARSQAGKEIRCVYCRTPWQGDEESLKRLKSAGKVNGEGYVNVAGELGLSGARDYSTYHQHWVRRQGLGYY
ncbi:MAG: hypothetical protein ASARMPREDX12_005305 [Alectoria sarmentosa]|nr:MAG: hypothetical protein ASARMPRED_005123 [Alectoria sarmentosa]CAD6591675.1 MAG: hypothetical protein ASARMPREDX12_005305 [Alectoria sarmentosa]